MNTSLTRLMSAINEDKISKYWASFFREHFRGEINDQLIESFEASGLSKADIARKLDRRPEQITRWLSAPCNLEIDTISDLALSMGLVPKIRLEKIAENNCNNMVHSFIYVISDFESKSTSGQFVLHESNSYDSSSKESKGMGVRKLPNNEPGAGAITAKSSSREVRQHA